MQLSAAVHTHLRAATHVCCIPQQSHAIDGVIRGDHDLLLFGTALPATAVVAHVASEVTMLPSNGHTCNTVAATVRKRAEMKLAV